MLIESLQNLPAPLRDFYVIVKALKVKASEAKREQSKAAALDSLTACLGGDPSMLVVSQRALALFSITTQSCAQFDRADKSHEVRAIIETQNQVRGVYEELADAMEAGEKAGKVILTPRHAIRVEILPPARTESMMRKFGPAIRALRG